MQLQGAHVLVTGASRGIGAAMARHFAAAGATVSVAARSVAPLESLAAELTGRAFPVDLLDRAAVDGFIDRVETEAGPVDVLVNNAGLENSAFFLGETADTVRDVVALNLEVPMLLTRAVLPGMLHRRRGHLVFLSSLAGTAGFPGMAIYSGTKGGVNNFVGALRIELRDTPVHTTLVAPGPVDTEMWDTLETKSDLQPILDRMNTLHLIPKKSPELIARRTVAAVVADRRHVRTPRRLSASFWLGESPRRIAEMLLAGVPMKDTVVNDTVD
jgi:short-subunit dehydrogenase